MLFIKAGICAVYARTMSELARAMLLAHGIPASYETLTDRIINREGTGLCPMESAVAHTDDIDLGVELIFRRLDELKAARK